MKIKLIVSLFIIAGFLVAPVQAKQDKHKRLPPGLQKKMERGGTLPPGWEKKLRKGAVLEKNVYDHGAIVAPLDKKGIVTIKVDHKVIRLYKATREIVEILK